MVWESVSPQPEIESSNVASALFAASSVEAGR